MLTGTPIYNTFSDLVGQTMLLPCGGLFKSLEHFRSIFRPVNEFNPQGVWRDLYRRLYQVLIMAHPKNVIDILPIRVVSREVKLTDRITILRIDTLMVKFDYLSIIDHHCKDGSARKNMFIKAMGVLSQTKQLSACPLLLGGTLCNPKHARPRNLWQQPFNCSEHDTLKLPLTEWLSLLHVRYSIESHSMIWRQGGARLQLRSDCVLTVNEGLRHELDV